MSTNELYGYVPITEREPVPWPDGKRIAFYVGLNIEHFRVELPVAGSIAQCPPDPLSHGYRDYGNRVGIWRLIDLFDEVGLRPSAITSSEVCQHYPQIVEAGVARDWAWVAHGKTNSILHTGMEEEEEATFLDEMFAMYDAVLPARPKGWFGPGLTETFHTPRLLQERGLTYLLDWVADDRPFELNLPGMLSVPYNLDVNDYPFFVDKGGWGAVRADGDGSARGAAGRGWQCDGASSAPVRDRSAGAVQVPSQGYHGDHFTSRCVGHHE